LVIVYFYFLATKGNFILKKFFSTGLTIILGEWVLMLVHFIRSLTLSHSDTLDAGLLDANSTESLRLPKFELKLDGFLYIWLGSTAVSYLMYFGIGGFLHVREPDFNFFFSPKENISHYSTSIPGAGLAESYRRSYNKIKRVPQWYFYVRQRDKAQEWKCQPNTWLSPALERHEIMVGSSSLVLGSALSAVFASHIINGGWSMVYYNFSDHPWWWTVLQIPAIFIYQVLHFFVYFSRPVKYGPQEEYC
jgi:hypothetical protein